MTETSSSLAKMRIERTAESVKEAIEEGFARTPPPDPRRLTDTYDDEGVGEYFGGRPWQGHSVHDLRYHSCALSFFTAPAFRYYLPAFMLAAIDSRREADIIPDKLWRRFLRWTSKDHLLEVTVGELFPESERRAIAEFFRYESDWKVRRCEPSSYPWEAVSAVERPTRVILANLGCLLTPETLRCREIRKAMAEQFQFPFEEEPPHD